MLLNADGRRSADITPWMTAGLNTLTLRVCGRPKNLLGPHFTTARGSTWPAMWKHAPMASPAPAAYDLLPFGLYDAPVLTIGD